MAIGAGMVFNFGGNTAGLQNAANNAVNIVNRTTQGATRGYSKGAQLAVEAGRGVEDAMAGFATRGWQGLVLGATNNLAAMATVLHPLAGGFVGLVGGLTILTMALTKFGEGAEDAKKELEELRKATDKADLERGKLKQKAERGGMSASEGRAKINEINDEIKARRELAKTREDDYQKEIANQKHLSKVISSHLTTVDALKKKEKDLNKEYSDRAAGKPGARPFSEIQQDIQETQGRLYRRKATLAQAETSMEYSKLLQGQARQSTLDARKDITQLQRDRANIEAQMFRPSVGEVMDRLTKKVPLSLSGGEVGGAEAAKAIAEAFAEKEPPVPSQDRIERAIRDQVAENKRQTTILDKIEKAIRDMVPAVGVNDPGAAGF